MCMCMCVCLCVCARACVRVCAGDRNILGLFLFVGFDCGPVLVELCGTILDSGPLWTQFGDIVVLAFVFFALLSWFPNIW